jgi:hypothetical protein
MPEKSRQRRVQIARRQGKTTAVKSSDVGMAQGLSRHAAKKSAHVEGLRHPLGRSVSRKAPPGTGRDRLQTPERFHESEQAPAADLGWATARLSGTEHHRAEQKILSRRSRSASAAKARRLRGG